MRFVSVFSSLNDSIFTTPDFLESRHLPSLDGWRAVAIMLVILGHAKLTEGMPPSIYYLLDILVFAELGVRIFFIISGFLITTLLIKEFNRSNRINLKLFYIRRFLRICRVYYVYLFVIILINNYLQLEISKETFIAAFLYITNFQFAEGSWFTGHSWSLAVEEQFYLFWPVLFLINIRRLVFFCILILLCLPLLRVYWYYNPDYSKITLAPFLAHADALLTGCLLAALSFKSVFSCSQIIWQKSYLVVFSISLIFAITYCQSRFLYGSIMQTIGYLINNVLIGFLLLRTVIVKRSLFFCFLNNRITKRIGALSYSLYLWQQLFLVPKDYYYGKFAWCLFPTNILLTGLLAYFSYQYFESYFLRFKSRYSVKV